MKRMYPKKVAIALAIVTGVATLLAGCGQAPPAPITPLVTNTLNPNGQCLVNLISTPGSAQVNAIGFTATGIADYGDTIVGGNVPLADNQPLPLQPSLMNGGKIIGTVTVQAGSSGAIGQMSGTGVDGNIVMNETTTGQPVPSPYGNTVNGSGTVTISAAKLSSIPQYQQIMQMYPPGSTPMVTMAPMPQLCVNALAISLSKTTYGKLYGGRVYLYLSTPTYGTNPLAVNTQAGHGTYLEF